MHASGFLRVSADGQVRLPASVRHRWGLDGGGDVCYLHVGDAIIIVPGDAGRLRRQLLDSVSDSDWDLARQGFGDDDLATE